MSLKELMHVLQAKTQRATFVGSSLLSARLVPKGYFLARQKLMELQRFAPEDIEHLGLEQFKADLGKLPDETYHAWVSRRLRANQGPVDLKYADPLKSDIQGTPRPIDRLEIDYTSDQAELSGLSLRHVSISQYGSVTFTNCTIRNLHLKKYVGSIILDDCWVGNLVINDDGPRLLVIDGGGVLLFSCPAIVTTPFRGDVVLKDVFLPRLAGVWPRLQLAGKADIQTLRTLSAALVELHNHRAAGILKAVELSLSRKETNWCNRLPSTHFS